MNTIDAVLQEESHRAERVVGLFRVALMVCLLVSDAILIFGGFAEGVPAGLLGFDGVLLGYALLTLFLLLWRVPPHATYVITVCDLTAWLTYLTVLASYGLIEGNSQATWAGICCMSVVSLSAVRFSLPSTIFATSLGAGTAFVYSLLVGADSATSLYASLPVVLIGAIAGYLNIRQRAAVREIVTRRRLERFLPREVARNLATEETDLALGGRETHVSVLFTDIEGFSTMSETREPTAVVSFLNDYLSTCVDVVFDHMGTLDKFVGDEVMAVFGAPIGPNPDDAERAVRCALALRAALKDLNQERTAAGKVAIRAGIGVHSGRVVAGHIGSPERMEYTVIGDTVNVAARVEGLTRRFDADILVTRETAEAAGDRFAYRAVGNVPVKGRAEEIEVLAVEGDVA